MLQEATFFDGTVKKYNVRILFSVFPQFTELENNKNLFNSVHADEGGYGVCWNDELDLDAETIWEEGTTVRKKYTGPVLELAYNLTETRTEAGLTQKQLADRIGFYQADISKIERGLANPSLSTLQKLAEGMGKRLKVSFY